jgi:putative hydrolase of the HAD superfamily
MISALVFDIGNVLVTFDYSRAILRFSEHSRLPADEIRTRLMPIVAEMECGRITSAEFVEQGLAACAFDGPPDAFVTAYCEIFAENTPMVERIPGLAREVPLFLLSNTSGLHLDYLEAAFPVFSHFSGGVFSHLAGCAKPSPEIYRRVIEAHRLDPSKTLYLDDAPANTEAGAALGLRVFTYDFNDHAALEAELARLGLAASP